jgi:hypothetical protein
MRDIFGGGCAWGETTATGLAMRVITSSAVCPVGCGPPCTPRASRTTAATAGSRAAATICSTGTPSRSRSSIPALRVSSAAALARFSRTCRPTTVDRLRSARRRFPPRCPRPAVLVQQPIEAELDCLEDAVQSGALIRHAAGDALISRDAVEHPILGTAVHMIMRSGDDRARPSAHPHPGDAPTLPLLT